MHRFPVRTTILCVVLGVWSVGCMNMDGLPVYSTDQTDSAHAGHRRTTITSPDAVYVHDFEEDSMRLANPDPRQVVGHSEFGNGKICAIEGQDPAVYLAADMGSEMPAYVVFRNIKHPPF